MINKLNQNGQYKVVSLGLALGFCMEGRDRIPNSKIPLQDAFRSAWLSWEYRENFPAVTKTFDPAKGTLDSYWVIVEASERTRTPWAPFYWDNTTPGEFRIYLRDGTDWDANGNGDVSMVAETLTEGAAVPAQGWAELSRSILRELGE